MLRAWYRPRASYRQVTGKLNGGTLDAKRRFRHKRSRIALYGVFCDSVYPVYQNNSKTPHSANLIRIRAKEKRRYKPTLFLLLFGEFQKQEHGKAEDRE